MPEHRVIEGLAETRRCEGCLPLPPGPKPWPSCAGSPHGRRPRLPFPHGCAGGWGAHGGPPGGDPCSQGCCVRTHSHAWQGCCCTSASGVALSVTLGQSVSSEPWGPAGCPGPGGQAAASSREQAEGRVLPRLTCLTPPGSGDVSDTLRLLTESHLEKRWRELSPLPVQTCVAAQGTERVSPTREQAPPPALLHPIFASRPPGKLPPAVL